jgi:hypothetical protein
VRLYGLETPELWEELGPQYQRHLEELCSVDGRGRLMIVWEGSVSERTTRGFLSPVSNEVSATCSSGVRKAGFYT